MALRSRILLQSTTSFEFRIKSLKALKKQDSDSENEDEYESTSESGSSSMREKVYSFRRKPVRLLH